MKLAVEFCELAALFHQDCLDFTDSKIDEKEWITSIAKRLNPKFRVGAIQFIAEALSSDMTDKELENLWANSGSDLFITGEGGIRFFLSTILQELKRG